MENVDIVIVGAGVVGLAAAYELSARFPQKSILVLEKNPKFGQELSSRTSEVIHSGVYYPTGSLKARLCVDGNKRLYEFCRRYDVPHKKLGKVIIARSERELLMLEALMEQGRANGVTGLEYMGAGEVESLEPHIKALAGIYSPSSGIVDTHSLMARLEYLVRERGVMVVYNCQVTGVSFADGGYMIACRQGDSAEQLSCRWLINSAGLAADQIPAMLGIDIDAAGYRVYKCKGAYFAVTNEKAAMVSRLVFPASIRELKGTGIPVLKDMNGRMRLGPDAHYAPINITNYDVNKAAAARFLDVVQEYLPFLEQSDLVPDIAGLRPRLLVPCGSPPRDFVVCHENERGLPGLINLLGIESPGLTCCLSLGSMIGDMISDYVS